MDNIPPEIWLHVAKFVPKEDLYDLLGVNTIFFNIAMDIRYREIVISTTTMQDIIKIELETLKRLSNPFVASRVYRLELRLGDIRKVLGSGTIRRQLKHIITRVFGGSKLPVSVTGLIKDIIKITNRLVNVRELCIDLWDLLSPSQANDLQPLFSSFWSSFGPKLHSLSLNGNLGNFSTTTLIKNPRKLDGLQELCVEFNGIAGRAIIVDVLVPFINNLAPHLLSLRLWCRPSLDLSTFFAQLAPFPVLKTLIIHTPINKKVFRNTSGLEDLICDHSSGTQQKVHLFLNSTGSLTADSEDPLSQWFLEYISKITRLSYLLQILDLYPTDMYAGIEFLLDCIERNSQSLAELNVRDRYLQDGGIEAIINVASYSNLVYLKMKILKLDVALTDHLALKLPKIDRIRLSIREYSVDDPQYLVNTFVQDLDMRSYLYQLEVVGQHHLIWSGRLQ